MGEMEFLVRERRDVIKTLLVKLSFAIVSSFTGYMISRHRLRLSHRYYVTKSSSGLEEILYLHKNEKEDIAKIVSSISIFNPNKAKEEISIDSEIPLYVNEDLRAELEENKETIRSLNNNLRLHEEGISNLDRRGEVLREKLQQMINLKKEMASLKMINSELSRENLTLITQMDILQMSFSEAEKLREEADDLRRENESLKKYTEQLEMDRCKDAEQSVYLKWVNACLRYELRNCKSPSGITTAKDLSKSASPNSQEKAKLLILQYESYKAEFSAENEDVSSFCTSIEEYDDARVEKNRSLHIKCTNDIPNKTKILSKFGQITKGNKDDHNNLSLAKPKASVPSFPIGEDQLI